MATVLGLALGRRSGETTEMAEDVQPQRIAWHVPVLIFLAAQTAAGIWWAATVTADMRNLGDLLKVQEAQRSIEINQLRSEVQTIKQDMRTLEVYNQNLRERLAARGLLITEPRR